jgi:hypothetical protein
VAAARGGGAWRGGGWTILCNFDEEHGEGRRRIRNYLFYISHKDVLFVETQCTK